MWLTIDPDKGKNLESCFHGSKELLPSKLCGDEDGGTWPNCSHYTDPVGLDHVLKVRLCSALKKHAFKAIRPHGMDYNMHIREYLAFL